MNLKEILKQSLMQGVNQFVDSALTQMQEESDREFEEELEMHEEMLEEVIGLLATVGALKEFDKSLKGIDEIWNQAMLIAIILSGNGIEDIEFDDCEGFSGVIEDLYVRWSETKLVMDDIIQSEIGKSIALPMSSHISLQEACDIFYEEIIQLQEFEEGIFAIRKFKKKVQQCSGKLCALCTEYILNIRTLKEIWDNI